uniref:Uncharacterized protein n=1 Tax=Oryza punctata TaxID=4537 RepID=A0A0E0LKB8_ORYPU
MRSSARPDDSGYKRWWVQGGLLQLDELLHPLMLSGEVTAPARDGHPARGWRAQQVISSEENAVDNTQEQ